MIKSYVFVSGPYRANDIDGIRRNINMAGRQEAVMTIYEIKLLFGFYVNTGSIPEKCLVLDDALERLGYYGLIWPKGEGYQLTEPGRIFINRIMAIEPETA